MRLILLVSVVCLGLSVNAKNATKSSNYKRKLAQVAESCADLPTQPAIKCFSEQASMAQIAVEKKLKGGLAEVQRSTEEIVPPRASKADKMAWHETALASYTNFIDSTCRLNSLSEDGGSMAMLLYQSCRVDKYQSLLKLLNYEE